MRDQQATERLSALLAGVARRTENQPDVGPTASVAGHATGVGPGHRASSEPEAWPEFGDTSEGPQELIPEPEPMAATGRAHMPPHGREPGEFDTGSRHREPVAVRRFFTRPAFIVLSVVLLAVCGVSAMSLLPGNAETEPVVTASSGSSGREEASESDVRHVADSAPSASASTSGTKEDAGAQGTGLTVHVVGEVKKPSVVHLAPGSRVMDAVKAAGGLTDTAVTERVNLAQLLTDGQQVVIPNRETPVTALTHAAPPGTAGTATGPGETTSGASGNLAAGAGARVNLNTATAAELETLPRVGPVLAQRIVDFRTEHGPFTAVEELDGVSGVGAAMMEALMPMVTI